MSGRSMTWRPARSARCRWTSCCSPSRASPPREATDMHPIRTALGRRDLRLLLSAGLISQLGDWVLRVGLTYYIYVLTGSTLASALMLVASFVPQILLGSLAGVFVDRWEPRLTMIGANLLLAGGV